MAGVSVVVESLGTRASLILRIGEGDVEAWREYVGIYMPRIRQWARRWRISPDDVDDVVQDVLFKVQKGAKTFAYDRDKGRYRAWLKTVAHNVSKDCLKKTSQQPLTNGRTDEIDPMSLVADEKAGDSLMENLMDAEREAHFRQAEQITRDESSALEWESYYQWRYLKKKPPEIAASLGITLGNYYTRKSVFIARLKKNFDELDQ